jgi:hypothetical protein
MPRGQVSIQVDRDTKPLYRRIFTIVEDVPGKLAARAHSIVRI